MPVCPVFCSNLNKVHDAFFLTLIGRMPHTQRDSSGLAMRPAYILFEYYEDGHTCVGHVKQRPVSFNLVNEQC